MNIEKLKTQKADALDAYKLAKNEYLNNPTKENWISFCDAKTNCMRLGVII